MSVWVSVTFVYYIETIKPIFKLFSPSGNHTILVFSYQTLWQYCDGERRMQEGYENIAISDQYLALG